MGLVIRRGIIQEVRAYDAGLPECNVSLIGKQGEIVPKPAWDDHAMTLTDGGERERLVLHTELLAHKRSLVQRWFTRITKGKA